MKICWLSDLNLQGSGYLNLSVPLCIGLAEQGHEIKVAGLKYKGDEHEYPFSIIPCDTLNDAAALMQNLYTVWGFDILVVALDIPVQASILQMTRDRPFKYLGIMPIEADPLSMTWAMILMQMDKQLIISEFGTEEAHKAGVMSAEHIQLGLDTDAWKMPSDKERTKIRKSLGLEDNFCVLTVADNQERKNLAAAMEAFAEFAKDKDEARYLLVTREHNPVGWTLRDYAQELGINDKLMIFERGMSFKELWAIYAASDCFMLTSKAEGLGLPLLEAMAVGLPCIGTDCTGMGELLGNTRGLLVQHEYLHRDPFGNGRRYWIDKNMLCDQLGYIYDHVNTHEFIGLMKSQARKYVESRTWDIAVETLEKSLVELVDEE